MSLTRRTLLQSVAAIGAAPILGRAASADTVKVLLDTDIGSDIDDAVALAYLLSEPRCDLLGITTVTGAAHERVALARYLVEAAGKRLPIVAGYELPYVIEQRQKEAPQAAKLDHAPRVSAREPDRAVSFLRETILKHKGEVTLLAVGPFTNVARLIEQDPQITRHLKELVIMGGKYSDYPTPWGPTEWNAIVDPHATDLMFRGVHCPVRAFGLDITWRLGMLPDEVASQFSKDPLLQIVLDWSEVWFAERAELHFHDPLAALAIFHPEVCEYQAGHVQVELESGPRQGVTEWHPDPASLVRIASGVSESRFYERFFQTFRQ
ncbi:MAG: nucleoside hydrolase [Pseudomonadales bacterium]|nr:nucleoside hydrolase [Pseudomonadales bacterium]MBO6566640.1 nucleoside hydrolase [Pseudomonadales bacterium]MBO6595729.1 nucleoside hydrolase [Pseudomonadales bacterium]MBO6658777.1 nucleoside hydrolase [Pseudomonadales bacterium]MBO6820713.1 nucleoside hydrolase [Pseudomonadales bacterium]